jgi:hypothetical protein
LACAAARLGVLLVVCLLVWLHPVDDLLVRANEDEADCADAFLADEQLVRSHSVDLVPSLHVVGVGTHSEIISESRTSVRVSEDLLIFLNTDRHLLAICTDIQMPVQVGSQDHLMGPVAVVVDPEAPKKCPGLGTARSDAYANPATSRSDDVVDCTALSHPSPPYRWLGCGSSSGRIRGLS